MKMLGVMIMYFRVSSSICDIMDNAYHLSDIYLDQDSKWDQTNDIVDSTHECVSQSMMFFEKFKDRNTSKREIRNKNDSADEIKNTARKDVRKRMKIDAAMNCFFSNNYPTSYYKYNFSTGIELNAEGRLLITEQSVNEAVVTRNQTKIKKSLSKCTYLAFLYISKYGPIARVYIQMADCMALMAHLIYSKPMFISAINLFDYVMTMPTLSDAQFTIVEKRKFTFLSLNRDFKSVIDLQ